MKIISSISLASLLALSTLGLTAPAHAADPDFGPNVLIFDPSMQNIQAINDPIAKEMGNEGPGQFDDKRFALLFKPGNYGQIDLPVGYYTEVLGLGESPTAVVFTGRGPRSAHYGNVTQTFWRAVENLTVNNSSEYYWGVSQGTALRRVNVPGNKLNLFGGGWASGGFDADCAVAKNLSLGGQQQWFSRNSTFGNAGSAVWNMVFVGCPNTPTKWPTNTSIPATPLIAEKPYLFIDASGAYAVKVPALRKDSNSTDWVAGVTPGKVISINDFYIAHATKTDKSPADTAASINAALTTGKNLLLTPGIYHLEDSIKITRPDTVVLGIGYPTLIPDKGTPAMKVANVNGVKIGTLLLQASPTDCTSLLQVGDPGDTADRSADPTIIYDIFARVGGAGNGAADAMVTINSNNTIGDNAWLWRADHGAGNGWNDSKNKNGLIVNGKNVIYYGLAVEHTQEYQTIWNADGGQVYFYQSEMPYDVPDGQKGWASYKVAPNVTTHVAYGVGIYSFNHGGTIADNAIESSTAPGVKFTHLVLFGNGKGGITHTINGAGPGIGNGRQTMDNWP
ncbi:MAG TPA: coagulation factor 5/8 type domain-containing protein [Chthoniobacteraceae bacterium]|nr:coagulation factor 5/8 type domain-containing protein [Chthoniobacteraceae bacterium]